MDGEHRRRRQQQEQQQEFNPGDVASLLRQGKGTTMLHGALPMAAGLPGMAALLGGHPTHLHQGSFANLAPGFAGRTGNPLLGGHLSLLGGLPVTEAALAAAAAANLKRKSDALATSTPASEGVADAIKETPTSKKRKPSSPDDEVPTKGKVASMPANHVNNRDRKASDDVKFSDFQASIWTNRFEELCEFRKVHGHCNVPHSYSENAALSQWVQRQRYQYRLKQEGKRSTLTEDRVKLLDNVGFIWNSHESVWEDRWNELLEYKRVHGNCIVPSNYKSKGLALWVKRQRRQYKFYKENKQSSMTPERIAKLEQLGFAWDCRKLPKVSESNSPSMKGKPGRDPHNDVDEDDKSGSGSLKHDDRAMQQGASSNPANFGSYATTSGMALPPALPGGSGLHPSLHALSSSLATQAHAQNLLHNLLPPVRQIQHLSTASYLNPSHASLMQNVQLLSRGVPAPAPAVGLQALLGTSHGLNGSYLGTLPAELLQKLAEQNRLP